MRRNTSCQTKQAFDPIGRTGDTAEMGKAATEMGKVATEMGATEMGATEMGKATDMGKVAAPAGGKALEMKQPSQHRCEYDERRYYPEDSE